MAEKRNIFLVGPMGAGKSTIGRQLAQQLSMEFYDSDQEIERRTGADVGWVFDVEGEEGFRQREEKIINELTEKQGIVLATGGGSVKSRETRNRLSARGVVVYLETNIEKQLARTQRDKNVLYCKVLNPYVMYWKPSQKSVILFTKRLLISPFILMIRVQKSLQIKLLNY
ncbi:shikimate kinase I [Proteus mirabilis]|uniref:Shikimate kinase 1 n=1 Tax=Proteus mirabilis TaxID=584 RepID=A0A2X2BMI1_PROMI|nr:shikimate kinase I [Proteus mirabilis]